MGEVDFGRRSLDYAEHRPGPPDSFYDRLGSFRGLGGLQALDVGTGPGTVALELGRRGAVVTGTDVAANQIRVARERAEAAGLADRCRFAVGRAERIEAEGACFDLATAVQCWHWFDASAAMSELLRVLRPGGLLVVASNSYLARHDELARATEELVLRFNPDWTKANESGLHPEHVDQLIFGGFELVEAFCYDHDHLFSHAGWRGRIRTCNGVGSGALSDREVSAFDQALAELMRDRFPREPVPVRHRVWATVARRPQGQ